MKTEVCRWKNKILKKRSIFLHIKWMIFDVYYLLFFPLKNSWYQYICTINSFFNHYFQIIQYQNEAPKNTYTNMQKKHTPTVSILSNLELWNDFKLNSELNNFVWMENNAAKITLRLPQTENFIKWSFKVVVFVLLKVYFTVYGKYIFNY